MNQTMQKELQVQATKIRMGIIDAVYHAKSGHPGGSLSIADTLTYLYFARLNVDPKNPKMPDRDRFVLSKGHCSPGLYSTLAHKGYFPVEELKTFRHIDSRLQGHPDMKGVPGVDMSTGSLGQGLSAACGMALSAKMFGDPYKVFAICGDGEIEEGQIWEAAMFAAHYQLDNLVVVIDHNGLQIDGKITEVCSPEPIPEKFAAFGWYVITMDAHDFNDIERAFDEAESKVGQPVAIVQTSTKGKCVSFMENQASWHGSAPNEEQYNQAMNELRAILSELEGK